ncbi:hypothetical protein QP932_01550 [Corynebacterium freneyi]|nr:hypothetical protein [Corynebacterium freneyi]MDK8767191.1 hypothetical protein [Corynebacterium freneyi]
MSIHVTDPDEGLSPRTSHPRFVELAPFGNDSGAAEIREFLAAAAS